MLHLELEPTLHFLPMRESKGVVIDSIYDTFAYGLVGVGLRCLKTSVAKLCKQFLFVSTA